MAGWDEVADSAAMPGFASLYAGDPPAVVRCEICGDALPAASAIPGALYADGSQAFACRRHLERGGRLAWFVGWAQFEARLHRPGHTHASSGTGNIGAPGAAAAGPLVIRYETAASFDIYDHLINHLPVRVGLGGSAIICSQPERLLAAFGKRRQRVVRLLERLHASVIGADLRRELAALAQLFDNTKFTTEATPPAAAPAVLLLPPKNCNTPLPTACRTIYVAAQLTPAQQTAFAAHLPAAATKVVYGRSISGPLL